MKKKDTKPLVICDKHIDYDLIIVNCHVGGNIKILNCYVDKDIKVFKSIVGGEITESGNMFNVQARWGKSGK